MILLWLQNAAQTAVEATAPLVEAAATAVAPVAEAATTAAPGTESAAEAAAEASPFWLGVILEEVAKEGALKWMLSGGLFMWPILILGVVATGVMIERWRSLRMLTTDNDRLRNEVLGLLHRDQVEEALTRCEQEPGPVAAILATGIRKFLVLKRLNYDPGKIEEQVVKAMDDYSVHIVAALEKHLPVLATVASVAPMVGFLGTVQGMIISFDDIVLMDGGGNIVQAAAAGISVALYTTCFGLIVGIPAYIAFNYFSGVINTFVLDVESSATHLIEAVTLQMALSQQTGASEPAEASVR